MLHNLTDLKGATIKANDGEIGEVEDFYFDDDKWTIRYMVVDTRNWLPGKKVIVAPQWIERASWNDSRVYVNPLRDNIQHAPEFDRSKPLSHDYESHLHRH